ncbi:MAG: VOC family protein [Caulobacter sp.]|nr:VOC family protein [Caulobacter sp.]
MARFCQRWASRRPTKGNWSTPDGFFLQILQADVGTADYARRGPGLNHVGFGAPDEEAVRRIQATMRAAGFEAPEIQDLGGARALFMKDPDGIRFEVTYYPPGVSVVD